MFIQIFFSVLIGYLLGSIPFALVLGKGIGGVDVRKFGSGNLGGTNVIRVLGPKVGIPVILMDIGKGVLAAWIGSLIGGEVFGLLAGIFAVVGHFYPVFAGFKGGKGVATGAGAFLYLAPIPMVILLSTFAIVLLIFGYVSLASVLGAVMAIVIFALPEFITGMDIDYIVRFGGILVAIFIIYRHQSNIRKLMIGEEKRTLYKGRDKK